MEEIKHLHVVFITNQCDKPVHACIADYHNGKSTLDFRDGKFDLNTKVLFVYTNYGFTNETINDALFKIVSIIQNYPNVLLSNRFPYFHDYRFGNGSVILKVKCDFDYFLCEEEYLA